MTRRVQLFLLLNVVGGIAVLGSYVLWLGSPNHDGGALWGSIPPGGRTLYTTSMLTAATGYLALFDRLLRRDLGRLSPDALATLLTILALVLFPSALWMPLTYEYLAVRSAPAWWAMRGTLFVVGAASVGLVVFLARLEPAPDGTGGRAIAIAGALAFTFQTAVLDAFVWPLYFPG